MSVTMKTHTDYDQPHMEELQRVAGHTFAKKQTMFKRGFALVSGLFCLGSGLGMALQKNSVFLCLLCCAMGLLLVIWSVFFYALAAWGSGRAMVKSQSGTDFHFERDAVVGTQDKDSARYPYDVCAALYETAGNFYFLMHNGQGLILDKANLRGGSADQLRVLLEEKTGQTCQWVGKRP